MLVDVLQIQGCACGNLVGLLVALIALGLYCYSFNTIKFEDELCLPVPSDYEEGPYKCPGEFLRVSFYFVLFSR